MNKKLGIGIVVIAIVAVAMFTGCVEEEEAPISTPISSHTPTTVVTPSPTSTLSPSPSQSPSPSIITPSPIPSPETFPTSTPKPVERAEISIISDAKPIDYEGYPALNVSIFGERFHTDLNVTVKNETGAILDTVVISPEKEKGILRTNLKIGDYHETLKGKEINRRGTEVNYPSYAFTVTVSDAQGKLADNTFRFEGAKVTINDIFVDSEWIVIVEGEQLVKKRFINGVSYTLANEGNLPAYPDHATFFDKSINYPELVLGRERKWCHTDLSFFHSIDNMNIVVYDKNNKKIAET